MIFHDLFFSLSFCRPPIEVGIGVRHKRSLNSLKRYQGQSENGKPEIMVEIKLLGSYIKDPQIFLFRSLKHAHLCKNVT